SCRRQYFRCAPIRATLKTGLINSRSSRTNRKRPADSLLQNHYFQSGGRIAAVKHALGRLLEVFRPCVRDVHEALGVAIHKGKPRALYLEHYAVALAEGVVDVGHCEVDRGQLTRSERLRFLPTVAELCAHRLSPQ